MAYKIMMSRPYARCPCETCIVLAICKGRCEYLRCPFLYKYMRSGIKDHGLPNPKKKYRERKLESIFGRTICIYGFDNTHKKNPDLVLWWENWRY